ncbi:hypothetical protein BDF21DRAFT_472809 [Thamnidium elegans]|nr:hypothetical protein BDF21DRAFT_472809 [Thamnidium elegans]
MDILQNLNTAKISLILGSRLPSPPKFILIDIPLNVATFYNVLQNETREKRNGNLKRLSKSSKRRNERLVVALPEGPQRAVSCEHSERHAASILYNVIIAAIFSKFRFVFLPDKLPDSMSSKEKLDTCSIYTLREKCGIAITFFIHFICGKCSKSYIMDSQTGYTILIGLNGSRQQSREKDIYVCPLGGKGNTAKTSQL